MSKCKILVKNFLHFLSAFVDTILILPFSHMKDNLKCKVFWEEVFFSAATLINCYWPFLALRSDDQRPLRVRLPSRGADMGYRFMPGTSFLKSVPEILIWNPRISISQVWTLKVIMSRGRFWGEYGVGTHMGVLGGEDSG